MMADRLRTCLAVTLPLRRGARSVMAMARSAFTRVIDSLRGRLWRRKPAGAPSEESRCQPGLAVPQSRIAATELRSAELNQRLGFRLHCNEVPSDERQ